MYNYHLGLTPLKIGRLSLQGSCVFLALQRCEAPAFCHSKIGALGRHAGPSCSSTSCSSGINAAVIYIMKYHIVKDAHILMMFINSEQKEKSKRRIPR